MNSVGARNVVSHFNSGDNITVLYRDRGFGVDPRTKRSFIIRLHRVDERDSGNIITLYDDLEKGPGHWFTLKWICSSTRTDETYLG